MQYISAERQDEANIGISYEEWDSRRPTAIRLQHLAASLLIGALAIFIPACAIQSPVAEGSNIQSVLAQAGFKSKTARTAQQRQRLQSLPEHKFTTVNQNGRSFYVWADKPNNRVYCGNDEAYRNYKELRREQQDLEAGAITYIDEPQGISVPVTVFYGWAPFSEW